MSVTVFCPNKACPQHEVNKVVGRQHLGQGVFLGGPLLCDCGFTMTEVGGV